MSKLQDFLKESFDLVGVHEVIKRHAQEWGAPEEKNHVLEDLCAGRDKGGQHEFTEI